MSDSSAAAAASTALLAAGRHAVIVDRVTAAGTARVRDLAALLGVSEMTIRRDIDQLVDEGALERIHGGAKLRSKDEPGFAAKQVRGLPEKAAIAKAAATLVEPGMVIGVSAGTTTFAFADLVRHVPDLTIVTNSLRVAMRIEGTGGPTVLVTGGERTPSDALVGPIGVAALAGLHLDLLLLGVHGADEHAGFTTPNLAESELDRTFIESAHRVAVLADHTKWGVIGMSRIAPLDAADIVVTDAALADDAQRVLRDHVGRLILAAAP